MNYVNPVEKSQREAMDDLFPLKTVDRVARDIGEYDDPATFAQNLVTTLMSSNFEYAKV